MVIVRFVEYKGWKNAVEIVNADCRVVVVPEIGRIMHYGFADGENLLWENPELAGRRLPAVVFGSERKSHEWMNFGGDKVWPLEQGLWPAVNGAGWPPDPWFDGAEHACRPLDDGCAIRGPVSLWNGGRSVREIRLAPAGTRLDIRQRIEKDRPVPAGPVPFTNWNVTQIAKPDRILLPARPRDPSRKRFHDYAFEGRSAADCLALRPGPGGEMGIFAPDPAASMKFGADADGWLAGLVGRTLIVERFKRKPDGEYPDGGLTVAAYACPDYAELEVMSPKTPLEPGQSLSFDIAWELDVLSEGPIEDRLDEAARKLDAPTGLG
jgi:hypothetical protein